MLKFLLKNIHSFFYSLFICIGFFINIYIVETALFANFVVASFFLYIVLIMEIMTTWFWAKKKLIQFDIPIVDRYDRTTQMILHLTLPSGIFWAFCLMIFSNMNPHFWIFILGLAFIVFSLLFINIRAYYEDKFKLEQNTHYIYDFIKLLFYLFVSYSINWFRYSYGLHLFFIFVLHFVLGFGIMVLNLLRYRYFHKSSLWYIFFNSGLIAVVALSMLLFHGFSIYKVTVLSFILFYISVGILHHKIKRDLTKNIVIEYIVLAILALSLSVGI